MLTGWKTLIFAGLTALLGVATTFDWTTVLNAQDTGYVVTGIGVITGVLRFFTSTPVGTSAPTTTATK